MLGNTINPLRYPGAKRALVPYMEELIRSNNLIGCHFFEPYAGSAVVGLSLLQKNIVSYLSICEKDVLIYAFWYSVFNYPDKLCDIINNVPITIETWHTLDCYRRINYINEHNVVQLGFAGLFFNRTNFSGMLKANPIGGIKQTSDYKINCRFNKQRLILLIKKLSLLKNKVKVCHSDALEFMRSQSKTFLKKSCFAYFDPPYYNKGASLYRHYYVDKNHIELSEYVKSVKYLDWIVSYDDAKFINKLYDNSGAKCRPLFLDYSCATRIRSKGKELLISNLPLPPFPMSNAFNM